MALSEIKNRLKKAGKTQVWLIGKLSERGISTNPQQLSEVLNGYHNGTPKSKQIADATTEILDEVENE